ncbi:MAG TPA: hypothetical protein VLG46_16485 [Anaerolineae bacterium]|nr:hypothetical protein [Anaerolineae bacterium]
MMTHHIPFAILIEYQERTLSISEQEAVEAHLAEPCPMCQKNLQHAAELLATFAQPDETVAPPEAVVERAVGAFPNRSQVVGAFPSRPSIVSLPRIIASLLFDNFKQAPLAAVRGAARSRQLLFTAGEMDIDLQITSERHEATLLGQVLNNQPTERALSPTVRLYRGGEVIHTSAPDEQGQFAFRAVVPGVYDLGVMLAQQEIMLEGLELKYD